MAKTKVKKVNRSYKTGVKNKSRLPDLTKHFNLSSPRGKLLSFMLTFAVIGSGFMVYQSFASTIKVGAGAGDMHLRNGARLIKETGDNNKKNYTIAAIPGDAQATYPNTRVKELLKLVGQNQGRSVRTCGYVRAVGGPVTFEMISINGGWVRRSISVSNSYAYVCTPWLRVPPVKDGVGMPSVVNRTNPGVLRISTILVEVR